MYKHSIVLKCPYLAQSLSKKSVTMTKPTHSSICSRVTLPHDDPSSAYRAILYCNWESFSIKINIHLYCILKIVQLIHKCAETSQVAKIWTLRNGWRWTGEFGKNELFWRWACSRAHLYFQTCCLFKKSYSTRAIVLRKCKRKNRSFNCAIGT